MWTKLRVISVPVGPPIFVLLKSPLRRRVLSITRIPVTLESESCGVPKLLRVSSPFAGNEMTS